MLVHFINDHNEATKVKQRRRRRRRRKEKAQAAVNIIESYQRTHKQNKATPTAQHVDTWFPAHRLSLLHTREVSGA